jgi:Endoplasmic reticulum protein ERp29, C-terminal domain
LTQGFARSASFDSLATKFLAAAADAKSAVMDEVTSAGGSLVDDAKTNAELYGRYMKKAVEKVGRTCACWLPSRLACLTLMAHGKHRAAQGSAQRCVTQFLLI